MTAHDANFAATLRTFGFIEAISRFGGNSGRAQKECSLDDWAARITTLFSPYIEETVSEREFNAVQIELHQILSEMRKN